MPPRARRARRSPAPSPTPEPPSAAPEPGGDPSTAASCDDPAVAARSGHGDDATRGSPARERVLVIACGALAREIAFVKERHGLDHLDARYLPATLHNTPDRIPDAVRVAIADAKATHDRILVGYGDCGTGGLLDRVLAEAGVDRLPGPHCYAFLSGVAAFEAAAEDEIGAFYLTDFLARQFESLVVRPLGLDRHPELRDAYFGHYDRLVYLSQTDDRELMERARDAARRLGLAFVHRRVGYGDLARALVAA